MYTLVGRIIYYITTTLTLVTETDDGGTEWNTQILNRIQS
jgi:hypothetical protein